MNSPITLRSPAADNLVSAVKSLLDNDLCVWCETATALPTSFLCRDCVQNDPGAVLAKRVVTPGLPLT